MYPFHLLDAVQQADIRQIQNWLAARPSQRNVLTEHAARFVPSDDLREAIHAAIALGVPLFLSGEAGTGKTQVAYYVAQQLQVGEVLHVQVKSGMVAQDLFYDFDQVRYEKAVSEGKAPNKAPFITPRALWQALAAKQPRVLLLDEIDKAPRDFVNDILVELEKLEFYIPELGKTLSAPPERRPLVFITSNSERLMPDPFLRRCVYHHITLDEALLEKVLTRHQSDFATLEDTFLQAAVARFLDLRRKALRKLPSLAELLLWLRALALLNAEQGVSLDGELWELPLLGVLIKDHEDLALLRGDDVLL